GLSGVLRLISTGGISVRYLTIQNGSFPSVTGSDVAGLFVESTLGGVIVDYNIVRPNHGGGNAGVGNGVPNPGATAAPHLDGNLIVGNTASGQGGAGFTTNSGTGPAYITNNTVADNVSQRVDAGAIGGLSVYGNHTPGSTTLSNNMFWHNTNYDLYLY